MNKRRHFQVNEFISLSFEEDSTIIYVAGQSFLQCKYLLLQISPENVGEYDDIDSIDEVADLLDHSLEEHLEEFEIPPETEFWGHCSNLQVWAEYNYDTRLLHSNLAFPLLKRLTEVGDSIAKGVFQEEICKRFESHNPSTMIYLLRNQYISYLTEEQKKDLLNRWMKEDLNNAMILLHSHNYMKEFGEQYNSILNQNLLQYTDRLKKDFLEREYPIFLGKFGLTSPQDFAVQLLSERNVLAEIFEKYHYIFPDENQEGEIQNHTRLRLLKKVYRELYELEIKDKQYREVIIRRLKQLFESNNIGIVAVLLRQKFHELIPLPLFKAWIAQEDALFIKRLFAFYGNEYLMTNYWGPSQFPCHFLFSYLDDEALQVIAQHLKKLPLLYRRSVLYGFFKDIRNGAFQKDILRLVEHVMDRIELKMSTDPVRPAFYETESLRLTLENPNEIVIASSNMQLIITFPQTKRELFSHQQEGGFTRMEFFSLVNKAFSTIYQEHLQRTEKDSIRKAYFKDIYLFGIYHDPITDDVWIFVDYSR